MAWSNGLLFCVFSVFRGNILAGLNSPLGRAIGGTIDEIQLHKNSALNWRLIIGRPSDESQRFVEADSAVHPWQRIEQHRRIANGPCFSDQSFCEHSAQSLSLVSRSDEKTFHFAELFANGTQRAASRRPACVDAKEESPSRRSISPGQPGQFFRETLETKIDTQPARVVLKQIANRRDFFS